MGIFGLTSYISENSAEFLKDHKLHNCSILIDGNAAASLIYSHYTKCIHAFGGDYDKFANCIIEFIELLRKCNVYPCFIFDGGYEKRKLKTVIERIKLNIIICNQFKHKFRESKCFPLLLRDVFKDVLRSINIPVIQCDFEADQELVVLARIFKCPVISNDSDFYISDAVYIPFSTLEFKAYRLNKKVKNKFYLKCKVYNVDNLLNKFGGLSDKSLLPLMSCVLGNDYIPPNTFKHFLGITTSVKLPNRIEKIVTWLRGVLITDVAIEQLLLCVEKKYRNVIKKIVKQLYADCNRKSSQLQDEIPELFFITHELSQVIEDSTIEDTKIDEDLDLQSTEISLSETLPATEYSVPNTIANFEDEDGIEILDCCEFEIEEDQSILNENEESVINISNTVNVTELSETFTKNSLPSWLTCKFRRGMVSPHVINVHNFKRIFIPSQSEDYTSQPSHIIINPILRIVIAIILGKNSASDVKCHARTKGTQAGVHVLTPIFQNDWTEVPTLDSIEIMDQISRRKILLKCLNMSENTDLRYFPEEWKLIWIGILYWLNNSTVMKPNQIHMRAITLCLIYLNVIDRKIGFIRQQSKLNELTNIEKRKIDESSKEEQSLNILFDKIGENDSSTLSQFLELVSEKDCLVAAKALLHYHELDNNLINNRKSFDNKLVHCYAQLQHCIQSVGLLNSVLNFPYPHPAIHETFSGTFLYNLYNDIYKRKLSDGYITRTMLMKAKGIIALYRYLLKSLASLTSDVREDANVKKKKTRVKKKKMPKRDVEVEKEDRDNDYDDSENIYSLLSKLEITQ